MYKGRITAGTPNKIFGTKTPSSIRQVPNLKEETYVSTWLVNQLERCEFKANASVCNQYTTCENSLGESCQVRDPVASFTMAAPSKARSQYEPRAEEKAPLSKRADPAFHSPYTIDRLRYPSRPINTARTLPASLHLQQFKLRLRRTQESEMCHGSSE